MIQERAIKGTTNIKATSVLNVILITAISRL